VRLVRKGAKEKGRVLKRDLGEDKSTEPGENENGNVTKESIAYWSGTEIQRYTTGGNGLIGDIEAFRRSQVDARERARQWTAEGSFVHPVLVDNRAVEIEHLEIVASECDEELGELSKRTKRVHASRVGEPEVLEVEDVHWDCEDEVRG
jgi:hypothetical protein